MINASFEFLRDAKTKVWAGGADYPGLIGAQYETFGLPSGMGIGQPDCWPKVAAIIRQHQAENTTPEPALIQYAKAFRIAYPINANAEMIELCKWVIDAADPLISAEPVVNEEKKEGPCTTKTSAEWLDWCNKNKSTHGFSSIRKRYLKETGKNLNCVPGTQKYKIENRLLRAIFPEAYTETD